MLVGEVKKLEPLDRFLYWIKERHLIYLRRKSGKPKPWTDDKVLQTVFFTNPYRENDKTTVWFRKNVRDLLRNNPEVLMATVIFRWFNRPEPTGIALANSNSMGLRYGLLCRWNEKKAIRLLRSLTPPLFTGAFMIKCGNGPPGSKMPMICRAITDVWKRREWLVKSCEEDCRLQALWQELKKFRGLGGFMAYEIVCDLRYTYLLENASDVDTWTNPGPGCVRGLHRLKGGVPGKGREDAHRHVKTADRIPVMLDLLDTVRKELPKMPHFELREIEHSLCEWDKYERARTGKGGRVKRRYNGVS